MKSSFITTVFNEEKNISSFMNSILNQTKKPDEIIIVDGGSTDTTYEMLKNISKKNKTIKLFQEKGANIARGRNIAIAKSKGDIIFASDAGCVIHKDWVKETLKYFPKEDVVAGSYRAVAKNNFEYFQGLITIKKVDRPSRMSSRNISFKKKCWAEVGGYPESSVVKTGEDTRFNINLIAKGYKIKVNPRRDVAWEMRPTVSKFFKQYYLYGKGDRVLKNLVKAGMKKNLVMLFGFWMYMLVMLAALFVYPLLSLALVVAPLVVVDFYAFAIFIRTRKPSSLFWIPVILIAKRIGYIFGATFK